MERRRLAGTMAAMALGGAALMLPPLAHVFDQEVRLLGVPVVVLYLFGLWLALIAGTALLARRLPAEQEDGGQG